jgi:hypothetical protein
MVALGRRGSIAPTHSWPRHYIGWVVSVTPRPRFTPGERTPGTHCTGGWAGPRAGLDTKARGKILCTCRGSNPDRPVVQSVVRHYTAWATTARTLATYLNRFTCSSVYQPRDRWGLGVHKLKIFISYSFFGAILLRRLSLFIHSIYFQTGVKTYEKLVCFLSTL